MSFLSNRNHLTSYAALVLVGAVVYGRLIGFDFQANWDDNIYVLNNENVRGFSWAHLRAAFGYSGITQYNPLALVSFMFDYTLWGLNPGGYHLTNILLHLANGLLVYTLLLRWHGDRLLSLVAAALFLFHPVQVESVAWIAERKGLLSTLFFLLAWNSYDRYRNSGASNGKSGYIASLVFFVLSLLSKPAAVVFPLVLVGFDYCFSADRRFLLRDKIPFFGIAAVFSAITIFMESPNEDGMGGIVDYHGGSPLATLYTMLPVFCRYLRLLAWPSGLTVEHMPPIHHSFDIAVAGSLLLLSLVALAGYRLFRADRRLGFWLLFFWIGLLPVSQIVPLFLLMYEHYLYLPIIGAGVLAGKGLIYCREKWNGSAASIVSLLAAVWLLALALVSFQRTEVWRNSRTLFMDASVKSPGSFRVWEVLGNIQRADGNFEISAQMYGKSLAIKSDNVDVIWALGDMYTEIGELEKGYGYLKKLLEIKPTYVKGWATLGNNHRERSDYAAAEKAYQRALELQPEAVQVVALQGDLARRQGHFDQACAYYLQFESVGGESPENAYRIAGVESLAGNRDDALVWLEKAFTRGFDDYATVANDPDLQALWTDPRFNYLMIRFFPKAGGLE